MNATQHMNSLMTGSSPAAQILSLLGGQGQGALGGQTAGAAAGGGQAFAGILKQLAAATGAVQQAGQQGQASAAGQLSIDIGEPAQGADDNTVSLTLRGPKGETTFTLPQGHPMLQLAEALSDAGIDINALPPGLAKTLTQIANTLAKDAGFEPVPLADMAEQTENTDGEDAADDPLAALVSALTDTSSATKTTSETSAAATPQTGVSGADAAPTGDTAVGRRQPHGQTPAATSENNPDIPAQAKPEAQSANAQHNAQAQLKTQAQSADAQTNAQAHANTQTQANAQGAAKRSDVASMIAELTPAERASIADILRQLKGGAANDNAAQAAQAATARPSAANTQGNQGNTAQQTQNGTLSGEGAKTQANIQSNAAQGGDPANARALNDVLTQDTAKDAKVQVTAQAGQGGQRATSTSGLLSADTSAGLMAANQQSGATPPPGATTAQQPGANASGVTTTVAHAATKGGEEMVSQGWGQAASMDGDLLTEAAKFAEALDTFGRASGVDQLDNSVTKLARQPMTHMAPPSQVASQISRAAEAGVSRFVVQLSPAALGDVDVELNINEDGTVQANLRVEKPETLQMLKEDSRMLQQALENAGLKPDGGSLNFSLKQGGNSFAGDGGGNGKGPGHGAGQQIAADDMAGDTPAIIQSRHDGALDLSI